MDSVTESQSASTLSALTGKYLSFELADECYAINILKVQGILGVMKITAVPRSPKFLKGVMNLRGKIIPVVDLRTKLDLFEKPFDDKTCIVVVRIMKADGELVVGVIVDTVLEVLNLEASHLQNRPDFGSSIDTTFMAGLAKVDKKVVILLDIDTALEGIGAVKL